MSIENLIPIYEILQTAIRRLSETTFRAAWVRERTIPSRYNLNAWYGMGETNEYSGTLPEPDVLAQEIADDLLAAMEQFAVIANELKE